MVNRPCCPSNISLKKVKIANQTIGVMSTPKAGGTEPRIRRKNGSVGHTARLNGTSLRFAVGYHEITTRHSFAMIGKNMNDEPNLILQKIFPRNLFIQHTMAKERMLRKGPSTFASGCTQASVSETIIDEDIVETVVDIEFKSVLIIASIMFNPLTDALSNEATGTGAKAAEYDIKPIAAKS
jgi:hypothetical protein